MTEDDPVDGFLPPQYTQKQVFDFLASELTDMESVLPEPSQTQYGRTSKAAANALLARLYLNSEVYSDKGYYTECIAACNKVIAGGFQLENDYYKLFNADNHLRTNEIIFLFAVDATHTMSWGATSYLVCACVSSSNAAQIPADYGVESGWTSFRAKGALTAKFENNDKRNMFFTTGQSQYVTKLNDAFTGYLFENAFTSSDCLWEFKGGEATGKGIDAKYRLFPIPDTELSANSNIKQNNGY